MRSIEKRLRSVRQRAKVVLFHEASKFIIMSDCHRGQGNTNDSNLPNQTLFFAALEHYLQNGFTYIELGDGDELWENRNIKPIIDAHSDAFWLMSEFYKQNRFHMLYGNHDLVKRKPSFAKRHFQRYFCDSQDTCLPLFPGIKITEGLILENQANRERIFLVHGHQGSLLNDTLWRLARFLVRYIWRPLEMIGFNAPTGAGRPRRLRETIEKKLARFAETEAQILIAGHTHRPVFPQPGEGLYFNDGSCVHPRCITGLEIEGNAITLVKWSVTAKPDQTLYVGRQRLEGPVAIADYYAAAAQSKAQGASRKENRLSQRKKC